MRKLLFGLAAAAGVAALTYRFAFLPWFRSWGVVPADLNRTLPGDEIVPGAQAGETRSIVIDAAPAAIWPWLVQMGSGRGGWYSYGPMDMSATPDPGRTAILPEFQGLAVGDVMPTFPNGGFEVRILEPERALVLYTDTVIVRAQIGAMAEVTAGVAADEGMPVKKASGSDVPEFEASWAFVLEPVGLEQTKLIERFRAHFGETDQPWTRYTMPMVDFGLFMMMRKQLLGIKARAEGSAPPVLESEPVSS